jgi:hypothetical protein
VYHVTGARHAMHLAVADFLMKTTRLLIRIDQPVIDTSNMITGIFRFRYSPLIASVLSIIRADSAALA